MLWYITNICSLHLTLSARSAWKSIETMLESLKWLQLSSNPMQVKSGCVERKKKKKSYFSCTQSPAGSSLWTAFPEEARKEDIHVAPSAKCCPQKSVPNAGDSTKAQVLVIKTFGTGIIFPHDSCS